MLWWYVLSGVAVIAGVMVLMSVGVWLSGKPLSGSCGGPDCACRAAGVKSRECKASSSGLVSHYDPKNPGSHES